ncbi:sugar-binding domain-containing protein [Chitinophaga filiformis]|uniref:Glycosyl hydrolases family 2, TIM barrel domain n=1 Tax=Chitinophaga filiformis TaxID=104663 RepID=A0A1G7R295_CHIFI|nr:sugar-binding domain-containing protein [Chitinophaga filiformis]SDG04921.1 Glycosyl hydrolases family 2, TIM barrel domain [Chitinophaga filiformis]
MFQKERTSLLLSLCSAFITTAVMAQESTTWQMQRGSIVTRWAEQVNPAKVLPEYPRPQMVRPQWQNLNGLWQYVITDKTSGHPKSYSGKILVPYPIESALSGVKKPLKANELLWYKRGFEKPALKANERLLLHFGAVDFEATVYLNGKELGTHRGGYQHFTLDATDALQAGNNELVIKVWDPTDLGPNPHGKQIISPQGIMYTPSSGIWQTVWMETVPSTSIQSARITPDIDKQQVLVNLTISNSKSSDLTGYTVALTAKTGAKVVATAKLPADKPALLSITNPHLWSPDDPFLYDLDIKLVKNGETIDQVKSYFGMRKIAVQKDEKGIDRIFLNNQYTFNLGTLDQGFWPDGLYTAPTDAALKFDIEAAKAMGFNTIRKHIKIEPDRWYYHADKIGMLVWQDMVNPGNDTQEGRAEFERESAENIAQLYNHPCITTWVLFNEKWGQYDQERLTRWIKEADPSRIVNGHSGEMLYVNDVLRSPSPNAWIGSDIADVHSYPFPRNAPAIAGKARVLGEFGGIGVPIEGHLWNDLQTGWGYDGVVTPPIMRKQYTQMVDSLKVLEQEGLSASIYTQPFDVESEQNGLMTYDRAIIKLPVTTIRNIHARVWPATKNYLATTKGFSATVADTINRDYAARLKEYKSGKNDSASLRSLTLIALQNKDEANAARFSTEYINKLKTPLQENNLSFIEKVTTKKTDPGFSILEKSVSVAGIANSPRSITAKLETIIFDDEVRSLLTEKPDWNEVESVIGQHQPLEGELIRGLCVIRYLNAASRDQQNATQNLVEAATRYDDRYHSGAYNDWAWTLFEKSNKREELEKAVEWSRKAIGRETDQFRVASTIDTHANLLYKLGNKQEALQWQEKAVAASPGDTEIKDNYEKMKRGEPTWPNAN